MAKVNIQELITKGTPKKRMTVLIEELAKERFLGKKDLAQEEIRAIAESFTKEKEIEFYNNWQNIDRKVSDGIISLQGLKFEVLMHYSDLRGYIILWRAIEEAEILSNSILHQIRDIEKRKEIARRASYGNDLFLTDVETDEEGYLDINIGSQEETNLEYPPFTLKLVMNNVKREVEDSLVRYISWREAILDFMKMNKFNIKTYKKHIEEISQDVFKPLINWDKFGYSTAFIGPAETNKTLQKFKSYYDILPDPNKIKVNKDIYSTYIKEYLKG